VSFLRLQRFDLAFPVVVPLLPLTHFFFQANGLVDASLATSGRRFFVALASNQTSLVVVVGWFGTSSCWLAAPSEK
jgi:hypothetical protein